MALLLVSQHNAAHYVGGKYAGITKLQYLTSILGVVGKGNLLNITGCDFIVMLGFSFKKHSGQPVARFANGKLGGSHVWTWI